MSEISCAPVTSRRRAPRDRKAAAGTSRPNDRFSRCVVDAVFPELIRGFVAGVVADAGPDVLLSPSCLDDLVRGGQVLLFRLLVLLAAEARGLLRADSKGG